MIQNLSKQIKSSGIEEGKSSAARVARIIKNTKMFIHIPTNAKAAIHQIMEQTNDMGIYKSDEKTK